jgi:hypothetical protein
VFSNTVTIRGRKVPPAEVQAALDSRLRSPHLVTVKSPNELEVATKGGRSIHPWYVLGNARLGVEFTFTGRDGDTVLTVERARVGDSNGLSRTGRWLLGRRVCRLLRTGTPELEAGPQRKVEDEKTRELLVSLLGVYAGQFGSYTTLLWQVPALGLTAQAFLLTIALGGSRHSGARIMASGISILVALAAVELMHFQRGRAINHAELLRRVSEKLSLRKLLGDSMELEDAMPKKTNAQNVWEVDHIMYHVWKWCMISFAIADGFIIVSAVFNLSWL